MPHRDDENQNQRRNPFEQQVSQGQQNASEQPETSQPAETPNPDTEKAQQPQDGDLEPMETPTVPDEPEAPEPQTDAPQFPQLEDPNLFGDNETLDATPTAIEQADTEEPLPTPSVTEQPEADAPLATPQVELSEGEASEQVLSGSDSAGDPVLSPAGRTPSTNGDIITLLNEIVGRLDRIEEQVEAGSANTGHVKTMTL